MQPDPETVDATPGAAVPALTPGATIGRFVVRRTLGGGSFATVYLAHDPDLDREVAVKVPHAAPEAREAFLREARAAAQVEHPNVCQVHDVSATDNLPFIVSRFVGGGTLADYVRAAGTQLPVADALRIAEHVARGLVAIHARGIVHRDLKPGNVLYDKENDAFLITDFGLAKVPDHASRASGGVKGTLLYMSPEQIDPNRGAVGPLADVYALGVVLYELLTGGPPFPSDGVGRVIYAHLTTPPAPPSERRPELDARLDALCLRALAKAPAERFGSAAAFLDAIRAAGAPERPRVHRGGDRTELVLPGGARVPFAYCPPGEFRMGSPPSELCRENGELQYRVTIGRGFWMGASPVTCGQFARFVAETGYRTQAETDGGAWHRTNADWVPNRNYTWRTPGFEQTDEHPVVCVSWHDAVAFCDWASRVCRREVRLPTEAEWEYACRAGTDTPYYFGDELNGTQANCDGSQHPYGTTTTGPYLRATTPVGAYAERAAHPWGLFDVHGEVWELCAVWTGAPTGPNARAGPYFPTDLKDRLACGGSWFNAARFCRAAQRRRVESFFRVNNTGFRVVLPEA